MTRLISEQMLQKKIKTLMLTKLLMVNDRFITGTGIKKTKNDQRKWSMKMVNDDLEKFYDDVQLGKQPTKSTRTYVLKQLTEDQMDLLQKKDRNFLESCLFRENSKENEKSGTKNGISNDKFDSILS